MNIDRLEKARGMLLKIDMEKKPFSMSHWFEDFDAPYDCGTAACFLGHVARQQWAKNLGMTVNHDGDIVYDGEHGLCAAAVFFDVSINLAGRLCLPSSYGVSTKNIKPLDVSFVIQEILNGTIT